MMSARDVLSVEQNNSKWASAARDAADEFARSRHDGREMSLLACASVRVVDA
jgi:hypothetical protein